MGNGKVTHWGLTHTTKTIYLQTEPALVDCTPPVLIIATPAEDGEEPDHEDQAWVPGWTSTYVMQS